uniref:Cytochrome oxidase-cbb3 N-terminal domain-containing protein, FixP n=1 Tax=Candidatus Kentrum eta TaxID=2126337 RepID=A0A450VT24_9GAMM|nr:MAG: cytochrome oxidase-cbb3 N-terminal domain-containing protein, FixP [Candidatus Kentron sp. H]
MHYFELRNFQHVVLYLLPTLLFIVLFALGLGYTHFRDKRSDEKMNTIVHTYVGGIEERNAPFPVVLMLILAGTIIWGLLYIILYGVLEVKI